MLKKIFPALIILLFIAACQSQSAPAPTETPLPTATQVPTETALPTATLLPTETPMPVPTRDPSLFGSISAADAPVGFLLEPIAQVIFETELQKRVDADEIGDFQVEGLSIVSRGDGTFFAEVFYALQADATFWAEDFGTSGDDGWVRGKCSRFDFEIGADAYFLKNKAVCN